MRYAGVFVRFCAQVIDYALLSMFFFPITYLVYGVWIMTPQDHLWIIFDPICAVFLVLIFAYFILMEGIFGATAGKMALGLRIVDKNQMKINLKQAAIRNFAKLIDGLPLYLIGIISITKSETKQRVGDRLAGTYVIHIK